MIHVKWMALVAFSLALVSCPSNSNRGSTKVRLQIAVESNYVAYFEELASRFSADRDDVEFEVVATIMLDLLAGLPIQRGNSADLFMVVDDGTLASQHLIAPLNFTLMGYTDNALNASTLYNNQQYLVPMSAETTLLIYNTERINQVPSYLSQIEPDRLAAKFTDFYFAAGMLSTKGGYIFDERDNLGLASAGSIAGAQIIQNLYNSGSPHWSAMKDDSIAYDVMMNAFLAGDIDYIINGPWALANIADAGIKAGVAPIPSWDGSHPYRALTGIKGMGVNAYSVHKDLALEFMQFLASKDHAQLWYEMTLEVAPHTGVSYREGSLQAVAFEATEQGLLMPTTPKLDTVWTPMRTALVQIANNQNVVGALNAAQTTIQQAIADLG
jgi:arabinogalactan oligomer / maltooligosaccharide transport system substrate-binding protein